MPGARVAAGERITLRTLEREDAQIAARQNNPALRLPTGHSVTNQAAIEGWIDDPGPITPMVICLDDDADPGPTSAEAVDRIGIASVEDHGHSRPELAFFVLPEYQGEGYGAEAVSLLVDFAFQAHHHPAVEAQTFPHNEASRGLLESLGFTQEGRIRAQMFWDGRYRDKILYGLLREEWSDQG